MKDKFLLTEQYRPQTVEECILPKGIKKSFQEFVDRDDIPNLLLSGSSGVGKTTIARALCNELDYQYMLINASEDGNIDVLRTKIKQFANTLSFNDKIKVVILDEADYLNPNSTQPALRGFIEEHHDNCRFILTCNIKNRIISPIHSRCTVVDFNIPKKEKQELAAQFYKRVVGILKEKNIEFDNKSVIELIKKYFPDFRRVLNEVQRYGASGKIDSGVLTSISDKNIDSLVEFLKEKEFSKMRTWVAENMDNDSSELIRWFYDNSKEHVENSSIPQMVLILAEYQYKDSFVVDKEINLAAMLTEIMGGVEFK